MDSDDRDAGGEGQQPEVRCSLCGDRHQLAVQLVEGHLTHQPAGRIVWSACVVMVPCSCAGGIRTIYVGEPDPRAPAMSGATRTRKG